MTVTELNAAHKTILLIDDEDFILTLCQRFLERHDYRVIVSRNGMQALDILRAGNRIDLVITDLHMPLMGGVETLRHIRAEFPSLKVIVSSGLDEGAGLIDGDHQPDAFLSKPYSMLSLLDTLNSVWQQS